MYCGYIISLDRSAQAQHCCRCNGNRVDLMFAIEVVIVFYGICCCKTTYSYSVVKELNLLRHFCSYCSILS